MLSTIEGLWILLSAATLALLTSSGSWWGWSYAWYGIWATNLLYWDMPSTAQHQTLCKIWSSLVLLGCDGFEIRGPAPGVCGESPVLDHLDHNTCQYQHQKLAALWVVCGGRNEFGFMACYQVLGMVPIEYWMHYLGSESMPACSLCCFYSNWIADFGYWLWFLSLNMPCYVLKIQKQCNLRNPNCSKPSHCYEIYLL